MKRTQVLILLGLAFGVAALGFVVWLRHRNEVTSESPARRPVRVKVIAFNVQFLPGVGRMFDKRSKPTYRAKELARRLSEFDIVGLNELFDAEPRRLVLAGLTENWGKLHSVVAPKEARSLLGIDGGLAIASRYPITASDWMRYTDGSSPLSHGIFADGFAAKGALHARITLADGLEVDVILTHLESKEQRIRDKQYRELAEFIAKKGSPNRPMILLGDLNTRGDAPDRENKASPYRRMLERFAKAVPHSELIDLGAEYPGDDPGTSRPGEKGGGRRIDYIFLYRPKRASSVKVKNYHPDSFEDAEVGTLSDHRAVVAELEFRTRTSPSN